MTLIADHLKLVCERAISQSSGTGHQLVMSGITTWLSLGYVWNHYLVISWLCLRSPIGYGIILWLSVGYVWDHHLVICWLCLGSSLGYRLVMSEIITWLSAGYV